VYVYSETVTVAEVTELVLAVQFVHQLWLDSVNEQSCTICDLNRFASLS